MVRLHHRYTTADSSLSILTCLEKLTGRDLSKFQPPRQSVRKFISQILALDDLEPGFVGTPLCPNSVYIAHNATTGWYFLVYIDENRVPVLYPAWTSDADESISFSTMQVICLVKPSGTCGHPLNELMANKDSPMFVMDNIVRFNNIVKDGRKAVREGMITTNKSLEEDSSNNP